MLKIRYHKQFKKDFKLAMKRGLRAELLEEVLNFLVQEKELPAKYRDHQLTASKHFQGVRECHIQPDWLLVYKVDKEELILNLLRTGSHSDLF
ncbi:type II toxin-antitoxin system YafQ family toxin [Streptococcus pneumoniae]|nr:type II toxin-antitoxin system YafQ family toxin [Streptococcus pneumoniae]MDG9297147.1 type II toxin-antitoxin system YafQ family toxin [Streptococcus pneumoniae]